MRILVVGASGRTGRALVEQALERGHEVTALVRDASRLELTHPRLSVRVGSLADRVALEDAVRGQEAVVSALGVGRPLRPDPAVVDGVRALVEAMRRVGVGRLVYLSFVGVRESRSQAGPLIRHVLSRLVRHEVADHEEKEAIIRGSDRLWTIVRPPKLTSGRRRGGVWAGEAIRSGWLLPRVSRADVASFMLDQLTDTTFQRKAPSLFPAG
ncbi:MAG: SDR family oxidoreductase [Gaiellales bacterium]